MNFYGQNPNSMLAYLFKRKEQLFGAISNSSAPHFKSSPFPCITTYNNTYNIPIHTQTDPIPLKPAHLPFSFIKKPRNFSKHSTLTQQYQQLTTTSASQLPTSNTTATIPTASTICASLASIYTASSRLIQDSRPFFTQYDFIRLFRDSSCRVVLASRRLSHVEQQVHSIDQSRLLPISSSGMRLNISENGNLTQQNKKTFFYNYLLEEEEEEEETWQIEIPDIYRPPKIDLDNPWQIKIKITSYEVEAGALLIPYIKTFEYILLYWTLDLAKILVNGGGVCVQVWDVTEDNAPNKYEGERVCLWNLCNDDYALSCIKLFNSRRLGVGDEIGLFWNPRSSNFMFKLLSRPTI
uniref:B3 domain-containing protein n=1 Tax=Solanum tuberosum TaxID=4113 RepID=M1A9X8_SOLTU